MPAPNTAVDICNLALNLLGQKRIQSIDTPTSNEENICAQWFDVVRRALLREYIWRFAKARATITRSGTPDFDWSSSYTLPTDFIRFLSINADLGLVETIDYEVEDGQLLLNSDAPTINIRYVRDQTDVTRWDALFIILITYSLALRIAYGFTLKQSLLDKIDALYTKEIPKAVTINSQENPPRRIQTSRYLQARGGNSYDGYFAGPVMDVGG